MTHWREPDSFIGTYPSYWIISLKMRLERLLPHRLSSKSHAVGRGLEYLRRLGVLMGKDRKY
jgi:hypothetical protein